MFRDSSGKLTKFDARKKLISEIWRIDTKTYTTKSGKVRKKSIRRKTDKTLNRVTRGKISPQKFNSKDIRKKRKFLRSQKVEMKRVAVIKRKKILIDARYTIEDNLIAKMSDMISDIAKYSRRGNGAIVIIDFSFPEYETGETIYQSIRIVIKGSKKTIPLEVARYIIARLYANQKRMSSLKDSEHGGGIGKRGEYLRSIRASFQWYETKRITEL